MNKETLEKIYKEIQNNQRVSKKYELMIATVRSPSLFSGIQMSGKEEKTELRIASNEFAEALTDELGRILETLVHTSGKVAITANELHSYFYSLMGEPYLVDACLDAGLASSDIAIAVSPATAANNSLDMKDDEGSNLNLIEYYVILIQWQKEDMLPYASTSCNLQQFVNDSLAGTHSQY